MKRIIVYAVSAVWLSGCSVYRNYQRPEQMPVDSLYRTEGTAAVADSLTLGDLPRGRPRELTEGEIALLEGKTQP